MALTRYARTGVVRVRHIPDEWSGTRRILHPRVFNTRGRRLSQLAA
jgi:hypothetical protein